MKAQVLHKYDDDLTAPSWVDYIDVPDPVITKGSDVIVRIGGAGVCRTDLHVIEGIWRPHMDPNGNELLPLILGHEKYPSGVGAVSGLFRLPVPRHEFVDAIDLVIRQALENPCEPCLGVDVVHLGGLNKRVGNGGSLPAAD